MGLAKAHRFAGPGQKCCSPHSVTNTGTEDLIFLVIYAPPYVDGTPWAA
jgi:hypothetical protein